MRRNMFNQNRTPRAFWRSFKTFCRATFYFNFIFRINLLDRMKIFCSLGETKETKPVVEENHNPYLLKI